MTLVPYDVGRVGGGEHERGGGISTEVKQHNGSCSQYEMRDISSKMKQITDRRDGTRAEHITEM